MYSCFRLSLLLTTRMARTRTSEGLWYSAQKSKSPSTPVVSSFQLWSHPTDCLTRMSPRYRSKQWPSKCMNSFDEPGIDGALGISACLYMLVKGPIGMVGTIIRWILCCRRYSSKLLVPVAEGRDPPLLQPIHRFQHWQQPPASQLFS